MPITREQTNNDEVTHEEVSSYDAARLSALSLVVASLAVIITGANAMVEELFPQISITNGNQTTIFPPQIIVVGVHLPAVTLPVIWMTITVVVVIGFYLHQTRRPRKMTVDKETQDQINTVLHSLPHLSTIIPSCDSKTTLHIDQYKGKIPSEREAEIAESTIYEALIGTQRCRSFALQIQRLENLVSQHPGYCDSAFGERIRDSFFSRYSELEVYDALVSHTFTPEPDPLIKPGDKHSKKADFKIAIDGMDIYIEVFTPRLPLDVEIMFQDEPQTGCYDLGKGIGNNAETFHPDEYKVIREYEHHFQVYEHQFKTPTIFVVDTTLVHSDTPGLFGTANWEDIFTRYPFPDYIVGILVYRRIYRKDSIVRASQLYVNPRFSGLGTIPTILSHVME